MENTGKADQAANDGVDRRQNRQLRQLFVPAYAMIEPFFDPATGWGGRSLEYLALRVVRENFLQLSAEDVHTLIVAAHRVYIQHNPSGSEHLRRPEDIKPGA